MINTSLFHTLFPACLSGYLGKTCKIECPFPYYEQNCIKECHCDIDDCCHVNGCKLMSEQINNSNILTTNER